MVVIAKTDLEITIPRDYELVYATPSSIEPGSCVGLGVGHLACS